MFVAIQHFPPIKAGKDAEFREWFAWSGKLLAGQPGFISRRLLRGREGGGYVGLIEHESADTFTAMHRSPEHGQAHARVQALFDGMPKADFYDLVVG